MDILLIHKIIVILIDAICILLGFWIYFANRKSKIHQTFSLMTLFLFIWITFGYFGSVVFRENILLSSISARINVAAVCLFFIPFYFFSVYFPIEAKRRPFLDKFILVFWTSLCFLSLSTSWVVQSVESGHLVYGDILGNIFLLMSLLVAVIVLVLVFKKYFRIPAREKIKTQYLLIGLLLFVFFNIVFNIILPIVFNATDYYAFGDYSAILLLIFAAYAIIKRELFGIKIILAQILVFAMGIALLVLLFLVEDFSIKILTSVIFSFFCIFGYFLIESVSKEAKHKTILEQRVEERTSQLNESKKDAEQKAKELERWYKLTVGRELKMAELKKKIREMEAGAKEE